MFERPREILVAEDDGAEEDVEVDFLEGRLRLPTRRRPARHVEDSGDEPSPRGNRQRHGVHDDVGERVAQGQGEHTKGTKQILRSPKKRNKTPYITEIDE